MRVAEPDHVATGALAPGPTRAGQPIARPTAVELLSKIEFRGNGKVASEALSALILQGPLTWADTDNALEQAVLGQLVDCASIDEYEITSVLSDLSLTEPVRVTKMLMARADRAAESDGLEYEALPHHWDPPLQVEETGKLSQCLAMVRDWLAENPPSAVRYIRRDDGATLYARIAGSWSDQAFSILEISGASSEQQTMAVAQILSRVPVAVFLTRVELVCFGAAATSLSSTWQRDCWTSLSSTLFRCC